jgi:hypothetical protein
MHIDRNLARSSCVALLLTTACATAPARHVEPMPVAAPAPEMTESVGSSFSLFPQLARDAGQLATARLRWDRSDWTKLGVGALAVAGALLLDEDLREIVQQSRGVRGGGPGGPVADGAERALRHGRSRGRADRDRRRSRGRSHSRPSASTFLPRRPSTPSRAAWLSRSGRISRRSSDSFEATGETRHAETDPPPARAYFFLVLLDSLLLLRLTSAPCAAL